MCWATHRSPTSTTWACSFLSCCLYSKASSRGRGLVGKKSNPARLVMIPPATVSGAGDVVRGICQVLQDGSVLFSED